MKKHKKNVYVERESMWKDSFYFIRQIAETPSFLTWLFTGLISQLAKIRSICCLLKFDMPMLRTKPNFTNFSIAFQVST